MSARLSIKAVPDASWNARAACLNRNPDLFFPSFEVDEAEPKAICAGCPVIAECLDYAIADNIPGGIWGGLNEDERSKVRRQRRAKAKRETTDRNEAKAAHEKRVTEIWGSR